MVHNLVGLSTSVLLKRDKLGNVSDCPKTKGSQLLNLRIYKLATIQGIAERKKQFLEQERRGVSEKKHRIAEPHRSFCWSLHFCFYCGFEMPRHITASLKKVLI